MKKKSVVTIVIGFGLAIIAGTIGYFVARNNRLKDYEWDDEFEEDELEFFDEEVAKEYDEADFATEEDKTVVSEEKTEEPVI